jgi:vitamin B12 transporter
MLLRLRWRTAARSTRPIQLSVTACALAFACPAWAQQTTELPPIVVEGATLEAPPAKPKKKPAGTVSEAKSQTDTAAGTTTGEGEADASGSAEGVPIDEVGSAVSVVTGEQLRAQQIRHAADALRSLPGVEVSQQGTPNNLTVVRIRGAESNHTLVLIDGVEVNSTANDGFFDFSSLDADEIKQIEVLRGPQSGLYGSGALGGVINIITNEGKGPLTIRARGEGGAFNTRDGALQLSGGDDRLHGSVTIQGSQTDGFNISPIGNEDDGGKLSTFAFRGGVALLDNLKVDGTLRISSNNADRDGFNGNLNGLAVASDEASHFDNRLWVGNLQATLDTLDGHWSHTVRINRAETSDFDFDAPSLTTTRNISDNVKYGYLTTYRLDDPALPNVRHSFTGLIERENEEFELPTDPTLPNHSRNRTSFVGEVRGEYFNALSLTATVRRDDNDIIEDFTTWQTAGSLKLPGTPLRLHSSAGTGIKYPSLSEQFGTFAIFLPNPDLKPETGFGWDAGVETTLLPGRATVDITYFDSTLQDEIDTHGVVVGGNFFFQPFNRDGESTRRGIEVGGRYLVFKDLTLGAAYTYLDAREDDGLREIRRPPHSGRLDANYTFAGGRGNFNIAAIYNGTMPDTAFDAFSFDPSTVDLRSYWLVNLAASYEVSPGVFAYGRVQNALDQNYQEVFGYETAGLAAYAGLRFSYEALASATKASGR